MIECSPLKTTAFVERQEVPNDSISKKMKEAVKAFFASPFYKENRNTLIFLGALTFCAFVTLAICPPLATIILCCANLFLITIWYLGKPPHCAYKSTFSEN